MSATTEGEGLRVHVERMLDALSDAEAQVSGGADVPRGLLRVSAPISFARIHLAGLAARLSEQYPQLVIELRLQDRVIDMIAERIDVAIRIGRPRDSTAVMRKLADNARVLVAAPGYLDRFGRPDAPAGLGGHRFLRYDDADIDWRLAGPGGEEAEIETPCRLRADSGDIVLDWALAGHGIALKSQVEICNDLAAGRLEQVLPGWQSRPAPVYALYPSARHLPAKARVFLDAVAEEVRRLQAL